MLRRGGNLRRTDQAEYRMASAPIPFHFVEMEPGAVLAGEVGDSPRRWRMIPHINSAPEARRPGRQG
jgi:hypothetical protein